MCGIAGFARTDGGHLDGPVDDVLRSMAEALRPRGPDDMQFAALGQACLSFTRLAIIDPAGGRQPFHSEDRTVVLAANGEIYNHRELRARLRHPARFRSASDCEVLLHLYLQEGLDFLRDVRGMFGIAVIDLREQRLVLARDRLGIKPLFLHRTGNTVLFGSEVKALFEHPLCPRELDWQRALADQSLSSAPVMVSAEPITWYRGIEHVPPATILDISLRDGSTRALRYWSLPEPGAADRHPVDHYPRRLAELLADSVRECLVADTEIGLFLSGGIDSAGLAALSASTGLHTFSALTGSTLINGDASYAQRTAELLGLPNHLVAFGGDRVPDVAEWKRLLWLMESPLCGPEQFYKSEMYRFARLQRPELKTILLGSGADEFSGGYTVDLAGGGDWDDFLANLGQLARRASLGPHPAMSTWWDSDLPLLRDDAIALVSPDAIDDVYQAYQAWKFRDMQHYNLWVEDRTASGNAVEARVPYLDHRIVELLAGVPKAYRRQLFWNKQIVRDALAGVLPDEVRCRPKIAFYEGDGVRQTHRTFVAMLAQQREALLDEALSSPKAAQYLNGAHLRRTLRDLRAGRPAAHVEILLRVVNLGLLDLMTISAPGSRGTIGPRPYELAVRDFDEPRVRALLHGTRVEDRHVVRLAPEVLLLDDAAARQSFVAVDGSLRYVIDHDADAAWLSLLRGIDGSATLAEVADRTGCDLAPLRSLLEQALDEGLLELAGSDPAANGAAPALQEVAP
ncbi:asparagine synthase (glutamine-hydrolyzing) [Actinophytocola sp.]|uniref:asparagine synthase (glutamine-hydrolyzing) n=1 Tax=Actinophytocola sp. TaxID=1872138 RepID=UPI002D7EA421|nr:asparagine synthase (glutamine-hydrolyzing) [Actinophytocola sp.]HET9140042.1 asparagine synthase (glutamine-hydrolyzing) [Actinophytocola sp.]